MEAKCTATAKSRKQLKALWKLRPKHKWHRVHHIATALMHWRTPNDCVTRVYGEFLHCGNIPKVSIAYTLHPNNVIFHFVIYTLTNSIAIIAFIHSKNDVCEFALVTLENIFPFVVDHGDTIYIFPFSHLSTLGNSCSEAKTHKCSTPYLTMSTANRSNNPDHIFDRNVNQSAFWVWFTHCNGQFESANVDHNRAYVHVRVKCVTCGWQPNGEFRAS